MQQQGSYTAWIPKAPVHGQSFHVRTPFRYAQGFIKIKLALEFWNHRNTISRKRGSKQICLGIHVLKVMCALSATASSDFGQPESSKATQAAVAAQPHCPHLPLHTCASHLCCHRPWTAPLAAQGLRQEQLQPWVQHPQGYSQQGTRPPSLCGHTAIPAIPQGWATAFQPVQLKQLPFPETGECCSLVWPQKRVC